ncbi:MAG: ribonuclease Z [Candidatus Hadarchaeales archaeon]
MKLTFLGTTGSIPTKSRGLPSIAIRREGELILFDCGEGTQSQMVKAGLSPLKIDSIFLTHLHGDHFLGLAGIVQTMSLLDRKTPLEIFAPIEDVERIREYLRIPHYTLTFDVNVHGLRPGEEVKRKGYRIKTCRPEHSVPELAYALVEDERPGRLDVEKAISMGIFPGPSFSKLKAGIPVKGAGGRIVHPEEVIGPPRPGRKIVYTGDTKPTERIVDLARGADVLIHDATLSDDLSEKAGENFHSTPSGAATVAKEAGVKLLVLIHISPRYEDATILLEQAKKVFPNTIVAEDLMELEVPLP